MGGRETHPSNRWENSDFHPVFFFFELGMYRSEWLQSMGTS